MKKNRLYFGMLILMLVAVIIWAFYNMLNVGKQETSYRVSVVVENSNSDRWMWSKSRSQMEPTALFCR